MDKKPLIIVSICAVVLLVLGSLSNVVGYQSVKSTSMNDSPLFQTRTQRATNQQQNILTSQYLGKGNNHNLLLIPRPYETDSLYKIISIMQTMDDISYQRFVRIAVEQLSKKEKLKDVTPQQLTTKLHQIRNNPQSFLEYVGFNNGNNTWTSAFTLYWFPVCLIWEIFYFIFIGIPYCIHSFLDPAHGCCVNSVYTSR